MKTIITQITANVVEEILKSIEKNGISDIGKTAESLMTVLKEGALEILSAAVTETDKAVLAAKKERKIDGITVKQRNVPRTVVTSLGNLTFKRTYFTLPDGTMAYLTDQLIGIEPNVFLTGKGTEWTKDLTWSPIYLEIPVMCNFHLGDHWALGAGPYVAPIISDDDIDTANTDYGLRIGARYGFDSGFELGVDTDFGLNDVTKHSDGKHLSLSFTCGYRF